MRERHFVSGSRIWMLLLMLVIGCMGAVALPVGARAAGSIELGLPAEAEGAEITLYAVAEITEGHFAYYEPFGETDYMLEDLRDAEKTEKAAEQFASVARSNGAAGTAKTADNSGKLTFSELPDALYLAVQTGGQDAVEIQKALIPVPYTGENGEMHYEVSVDLKYSVPDGAVILHKEDETGAAVAGAGFALQKKTYISADGAVPDDVETGQDVGGRYMWEEVRRDLVTNEQGQLSVSSLSRGTYRFVEEQVPAGFAVNTASAYFTIEKAGQVQEANGVFTAVSGQPAEVTVVNRQNKVVVNKVDETGKALPGAQLVVKNANGETVYSFTSAEEPYELTRILNGSYVLSELQAPEGYAVAADIPFTVTGTEEQEIALTMTDTRQESGQGSLTVTKTLQDQNGATLGVPSADFYVALFSDEACTQRVTNVMPVHFADGSSASVTFENLELGIPYYVGETDEQGTLVASTSQAERVFAPEYPDGNMVTLTPENSAQTLSFRNVFNDIPIGYYIEGQLTVTKKVLRGTSAFNTNEVYYAGVYKDEEYKERYGELIKLEMNGSSEKSVTIPVTIGEDPNSSVTYYVTETDKDGTPLEEAEGLVFEVSVDNAVVTMSPSHMEDKVTITNTYPSSYTPPASSENRTESSGNSANGSNVRTGDETPITLYVALFAAAAVVLVALIVLFFVRRRKNR